MYELTVSDSELCEMKKTKLGQYWNYQSCDRLGEYRVWRKGTVHEEVCF